MEISEFQLTKVLGTMEVGLRCADRTPTDKVRNRQIIAALIEVAFKGQAIQRRDIMTEEHLVWDAQCQLPCRGLFLSIKGCTTQGCPSVNKLSNLGSGQLAVVTPFANS